MGKSDDDFKWKDAWWLLIPLSLCTLLFIPQSQSHSEIETDNNEAAIVNNFSPSQCQYQSQTLYVTHDNADVYEDVSQHTHNSTISTGDEMVKDSTNAWTEFYGNATCQAEEEHKLILAVFTGSDWCPPCKRLDRDVLSRKVFVDYAEKNWVLLKLDFPRHKEVDKELWNFNIDLNRQYKVSGYPSVIVLDHAGKKLGEIDYWSSATDFVRQMKQFK